MDEELITSKAGHHRLSLGRIGRRLALLLTFSAIPIFFGAWSSLAKTPQLVRVGIFQNRPIVFQDEHGGPQGLYVDLLRKIAQEEGWEIEFVAGSWAEGIKRVSTGEIDLMTSIAYTQERDAHMDFSNENVLMMWGQVYMKPDSDIQNILDLNKQKVAILKDGINGINFRTLCSNFDVNCQCITVDSYVQVFELVAEGKADAGVVNNVHGDILASKYGLQRSSILFNPFSLLFAVPEGKHHKLLSAIDKRLIAWKSDDNSFYFETLNHWFGGMTLEHRISRWLIYTLAIAGGLLLLFLIWTYVLKVKVKQRTREAALTAKAAQESEKYNRTLFQDSPIGLVLCRMDGTLVDVNPAYANIIGRDVEETLKLTYWDITPEKYAEQEAAQLEGLKTVGRYGPYEKEYIHRDGHLVPVRLSGLILERDGEDYIWSSVENITERKKAEEELKKHREHLEKMVKERTAELRESQLWLQSIFNSLEEAVFVTTPDRKVANINNAAQRMFGYSLEELRSLSTEVVHIDHKHYLEFGRQIKAAFDEEKTASFEFELKRKNGEVFPTEHIVSLLQNKQGKSLGIVSVVLDNTKRKQAEDLLNKRTAELQTMVNAMSGRETRMAELKKIIQKLCSQIESAGLTPVVDDPLKEGGTEKSEE